MLSRVFVNARDFLLYHLSSCSKINFNLLFKTIGQGYFVNEANTRVIPPSRSESQSLVFGPVLPRSNTSIHAAFIRHAALHPGMLAVKHLDTTLTYQELDRLSDGLAAHLRELGVGRCQRTLLLASRGVAMVVGIFGTLKAGASYIPLDGGVVTSKTLATIIDDSRPAIVLCLSMFSQRIQGMNIPVLDIEQFIRRHGDNTGIKTIEHTTMMSDEAYVIYTSGTTGRPKGVSVSHENVTNLILSHPGNLFIRPGIRVSQLLNIAFDMAAWEILGCISNGGTLVLRSSGSKCSAWSEVLKQVDVVISTPSILAQFNARDFQNVQVVATAGERCPQKLADEWAVGRTFWNCCGPTETTIINTAHLHIAGVPNTIGVPSPNNSVYVLDSALRPVPVGEPGLLWAGGVGVCKGYVNLPELTDERFRPDLFSPRGGVMYNTGDIGRLGWNGELEHLGREDDQVKIKGFRVELDGVALAISCCPGVTYATVVLIDNDLWAFFSPDSVAIEQVRDTVDGVQPYYARPEFYTALRKMPMTANGKVDKNSLKEMAKSRTRDERPLVA